MYTVAVNVLKTVASKNTTIHHIDQIRAAVTITYSGVWTFINQEVDVHTVKKPGQQ